MYWGPPTWFLMHTLASKVKEESFPIIGPNLILQLIQICNHLPCPECTQHAKAFWNKVSIENIKTKTDLINLLYMFHNMVNYRKKYPMFKLDNLVYYNSKKIIDIYNDFAKHFNTKGNMNLINESFHRNIMLSKFKIWLMSNIRHFDIQ